MTVIWGSTWIAIKTGVSSVPPLFFAATFVDNEATRHLDAKRTRFVYPPFEHELTPRSVTVLMEVNRYHTLLQVRFRGVRSRP